MLTGEIYAFIDKCFKTFHYYLFTVQDGDLMDKVEISWLKTSSGGRIGQIYSAGLEYCFISDDNKQCHPFVFCKDFLQDAVYASLHNKKASIYGFSYDPSEKPCVSRSKTRIAIANKSDDNFREKIPNILDFVNQFCKKLHLKPTTACEASSVPKQYKKSGVFVTEGSSRWMNSPPLLSMYSLLLRCGGVHSLGKDCMETVDGILNNKIKTYQVSDYSQLSSAISGIKLIIDNGYRKFFYIDSSKNYPEKTSIDGMHNHAGIVGFSSGNSKFICPYWHRKKIDKLVKKK